MLRINTHRFVHGLIILLCLAAIPARADDAKPSDAQIFGILSAANQSEINAGRAAQERATNKDVKKFAEDMIKQHEKMDAEGTKLAKKLKVTPETSPTSEEISRKGQESLNKMQSMQGAAFDAAYAEGQVADHRTVLATIDNTLLPNAKDKQLRGMLKKARATVSAHLEHAKKVQEKLKKESGRSARNER